MIRSRWPQRSRLLNASLILALSLLGSFLKLPVAASDASYFRSDNGVAASASALPDNLERPDSLAWRVPMDGGHSTPIIDSDRIFLTTWRPQSRELATVALDERTGKLLWRNALVPKQVEETHQIGSPANAT